MAGLSGIVKKISDLVTGTPADDDCFVFGKSDLKKITLAKLKDALGITSINSALSNFHSMLYLPLLTTGVQWQEENGLHFARWDESTTGTPYNKGITSASSGFQIGGRISGNNQFWISIDASGRMFRSSYSRDTGTWTDWIEIS